MNLQGSNSGTEVESSAPSSNTRRLSRRLAELSKTSNHEWLDALRDRCLYKRILATRALTELGLFDARLKRALFLNLSDSAWEVRLWALRAIEQSGDKAEIDRARERLRNDSDPRVRSEASPDPRL